MPHEKFHLETQASHFTETKYTRQRNVLRAETYKLYRYPGASAA